MVADVLQWGRDVFIPEIALAVEIGRAYAGFNGAGMFSSQKYRLREAVADAWDASMGPGCFHPRNSYSLFYSVFKDLRALLRAPLDLHPNSVSCTIPYAA